MDPSSVACPHLACPDKGVGGAGNVRIHAPRPRPYVLSPATAACSAPTPTPPARPHNPQTPAASRPRLSLPSNTTPPRVELAPVPGMPARPFCSRSPPDRGPQL